MNKLDSLFAPLILIIGVLALVLPIVFQGSDSSEKTVPEVAVVEEKETGATSIHADARDADQLPEYEREMAAYLSRLEDEEFIAADKILVGLGDDLPEGIKNGLRKSLDIARASRKGLVIVEEEKKQLVLALSRLEKEKQSVITLCMAANEQIEIELAKANAEQLAAESQLADFQKQSAGQISSLRDELENTNTELAEVARLANERFRFKTEVLLASLADSPASDYQVPPAFLTLPTSPVVPSAVQMASAIAVAVENVPSPTPQFRKVSSAVKHEPLEIPAVESIRFGFNSADVPLTSIQTIERAAELLLKNDRLRLQLCGHSDSIGNPVYNRTLSEKRSINVKQNLIRKGVRSDQIEVIPFGSSQSPAGRSEEHRRVDLVFLER